MLNLAGFEQLALLAKFILAAPHEFPRVLWRWMHQSNVKTLVWCLPYFFVSNAKSEQNSAEVPACPSIQSLAVVKEKQKTLLLVVPKLRRKCLVSTCGNAFLQSLAYVGGFCGHQGPRGVKSHRARLGELVKGHRGLTLSTLSGPRNPNLCALMVRWYFSVLPTGPNYNFSFAAFFF